MPRSEIGVRGEQAAAEYLERAGLTVVERNWRCKAGEVDIIALDGETVVFAEVKTRRTEKKGSPEEAVSSQKQQRYGRIAATYIARAGLEETPARFDVIAIRPIGEDRALLRHHRDAFALS